MAKDEIPRGQLSTIILMTLSEKDKYGYEIIDEVLNTTNGKISIKQPSLYSSLKRMEDQGIISSYWRDSDIGGKRHYYHLTDLGKKYLEKWKDDVPEYLIAPQTTTNDVKILQQENLFNIGKVDASTTEQTDTPSKKENSSFVQFDLFTNPSIVTPPSNENEVIQTPIPQNDIVTSYEKPLENQLFTYTKKNTKSFSERLIESGSNYEKKYIEKQPSIKQEISIPNTDAVKNFEETAKENANIENYRISLKDLTNYEQPPIELNNTDINLSQDVVLEQKTDTVGQKEEVKDDGVIITERLNIDDMPKPTKWDKRRFEVYVAGNNVSPDLKRKSSSNNYEDRIKDLYEQSKTNAENKELELIDNKIKFATYNDLKVFYSEQKIKFKPFVKVLKKQNNNVDMIRISKLNMFTSLSLFIYVCFVSVIFGIVCNSLDSVKLYSPITLIVSPILSFLLFSCCLLGYLKTPQKRITIPSKNFCFNFKIFAIVTFLIPIIIAINIMIGFSFKSFTTYLITLIYPVLLIFGYFVYCLCKKLLTKSKHMY